MAAILWVPTWRAVSKHQRLISLSSSSMNQPQGCFFGDSPFEGCNKSCPKSIRHMYFEHTIRHQRNVYSNALRNPGPKKKNSILGSNTCSTWASWVWSAHLPPTTPHHGAPTRLQRKKDFDSVGENSKQSRIPQDVFFQKIGIQNWDVQDFTGQDFVGLTRKNIRWFWLTNLKAKPG